MKEIPSFLAAIIAATTLLFIKWRAITMPPATRRYFDGG
jgi:hypothetical protein